MLIPDNAKLVAGINAFVKHVDELLANYWKANNFTFADAPTHKAEYLSDKWCRINVIEHRDGNSRVRSVYCFICLKDNDTKALGVVKEGDIHKAAGFKAPAKHGRGNVFDETTFATCATPHGIVYLRH